MKGMELKFAYLNYIDSNLKECVRLIEKYIFFCLNNYLDLSKDPFWKKLAKDVFVAIILNEFYNLREINISKINELFIDSCTVKNNIKLFCLNFSNVDTINSILVLKSITDNMLNSALQIIKENLDNYPR